MSLCELGPCRNLHVLTQKMDAERPLDGSPAPVVVITSRTCYPSPGIEYDLTAEPVKDCSRWEPISADDGARLERARQKMMVDRWGNHTPAFKEFLDSWTSPPE